MDPYQNIAGGNWSRTAFTAHSEAFIYNFDLAEPLAVTATSASDECAIKLWNTETETLVWVYKATPTIWWKGILKIVGYKIVCGGENADKMGTLRILNIDGTEAAFIEDPELDVYKVHLVGERIFAILKNGSLREWNLKGNCVRPLVCQIPLFTLGRDEASSHYIVVANRTHVFIYDVLKKQPRELELESDISSILIQNNRLFCGLYFKKEEPACMQIDLETGFVAEKYVLGLTEGRRSITAIVADETSLYLANDLGSVAKIDLKKPSEATVTAFSINCRWLALQRDILITGANFKEMTPAKVHFWNKQTGEHLNTLELRTLFSLRCQEPSTLFLGSSGTLFKYQFDVTHQGEKSSEVPPKLDPTQAPKQKSQGLLSSLWPFS